MPAPQETSRGADTVLDLLLLLWEAVLLHLCLIRTLCSMVNAATENFS